MAGAILDVHFSVVGHEIPLDHGYLLFSAIAHVLERPAQSEFLHESVHLGLIPIRGAYVGGGLLRIASGARFGLRMPADGIARVLPLAGKRLELAGHAIRVGPAQIRPLTPAANLRSSMVTTKNGQDESRFDAEVKRQLDELGIAAKAQRGRRKFVTIRGKKVIGHELLVAGLTSEESIRLQERGIGGRRKMGCGLFMPVTLRAAR